MLDKIAEAIGAHKEWGRNKNATKQPLRNYVQTLRSYNKIPLHVNCSLWGSEEKNNIKIRVRNITPIEG